MLCEGIRLTSRYAFPNTLPMKGKLSGLGAAIAFLSPQAFATTVVSSLDSLPQSGAVVLNDGTNFENWGIPFTNGTSSNYTLDDVTVMLQALGTGSPLTGSLYLADANNRPTGSPIGTDFTSSTIPSDSFGSVTFTPGSSIQLTAGATYVFVLSTGVGGSYDWQTTVEPTYAATAGWSFPQPFVMAWNTNESGENPAFWNDGSGGTYHFQGGIEATAVPEPALPALCSVVFGVTALRSRRKR